MSKKGKDSTLGQGLGCFNSFNRSLPQDYEYHTMTQMKTGVEGVQVSWLIRHVNVVVMNVDSYRLSQSRKRQLVATSSDPNAKND